MNDIDKVKQEFKQVEVTTLRRVGHLGVKTIGFFIQHFWKIIVVVGIALLAFTIFNRDRQYEKLIGQVEDYKQLSQYAAELAVKYGDQAALNEKIKKDWEAEKRYISGTRKAAINADFVLNNSAKRDNSADLIYVGEDGKQKYLFQELHFVDNKGVVGPPVGYVMIYEDGHVVSKVYRHHIDVKTLLTKDESSGRYNVLSKGDYILEQAGLANRKDSTFKDWTGISYPMNITGGEASIDPREGALGVAKFRFWDPHIDMGLNNSFGISGKYSLAPNVGFSVASYGRSKRDNSFRFLRIGVGGSKADGLQVSAAPFMYSLGKVTPVLSNTYIYPTVSWSMKSGITYGAGVSLSF